jgi:hypothetical protein
MRKMGTMVAITALFVAAFLMVSASGVVPGKGTNLTHATVAGEGIAEPLTFEVSMLRANVRALHAPGNGIEAPAGALEALKAVEMPYEVTLTSDRGRWGTPSRTYEYDGGVLLRSGSWEPGWYEATPDLADALKRQTAWAQAAPGAPPLPIETFATQFRRIAIAISLTIAAVSGLYLRGTKPANVAPSQMQERLARRDLQLYPGAWR